MKTYPGPKHLAGRDKEMNNTYSCEDCKNHHIFQVIFIRDEAGNITGERRRCVKCPWLK